MALLDIHRFTTDEFLAIDGLPERVELIDGVIYDMSPESDAHGDAQEVILRSLIIRLPDWAVRAGGSVRVTDRFCPIPDAAVYPRVRPLVDGYSQGTDARLVVEIGISTAERDRVVKLAAYASGGVDEVWLVAPGEARLTCHREPAGVHYQDVLDLPWPDGLPQAVDRLVARLTG